MAEDQDRPAPDALLAEARKEGRGRLKIFLGAYPGVGKTYAMLMPRANGARKASTSWWASPRRTAASKRNGCCAASTRSRAARSSTGAASSARWTWTPSSPASRRWCWSTSTPTPTCRAAPRKALPGCRGTAGRRHRRLHHLNVQHIESLNDVVARISRVRVRETLPDHALEAPTTSRSSTCAG